MDENMARKNVFHTINFKAVGNQSITIIFHRSLFTCLGAHVRTHSTLKMNQKKKQQNIVNPFAAQESNAKFENFPSMNQLLYGRRFLLVLLIVYTSMKLTTSRDSDLFDGVQFSPQKHDEKKVNKWFKYTTTYNTNWSLIMSTKFFA